MTDPVPFLRGCDDPLMQATAAEIERLRESEKRYADLYMDRCEKWSKLREALQNICAEYTAPLSCKVTMFEIARAALQKDEGQ